MARPRGYRLNTHAWDDLVVGAKKLTVTEVAALTGVNRASISGLLNGHTRASLPMARDLCQGLGLHVETLFPLVDRELATDAKGGRLMDLALPAAEATEDEIDAFFAAAHGEHVGKSIPRAERLACPLCTPELAS